MVATTDGRMARFLSALGVTLLLGVAVGWSLTTQGSSRLTGDDGVSSDARLNNSALATSLIVGDPPPAGNHELGAVGLQSAQDTTREGSRVTPTVQAVRRVLPSVVSVSVFRRERRGARNLLELFGPSRDRVVSGLGSGFAIDNQGTILTNDHVVQSADSVIVVDADGRTFQAAVIGRDELTDLAVLRIPPGRIPAAPLGRSSDLMVGEPAIAIGNPYGSFLANSEATVTRGVISGVDRDIRATGQRDVLYADMVQTDASINPGNSGGPLVNIQGEVIGVNSSIFSSSGGSQGLAFAIPIDRAVRVARELRDFGRIRRPWVGADIATISSDTFVAVASVRRVAPASPASRAGLEESDVIAGDPHGRHRDRARPGGRERGAHRAGGRRPRPPDGHSGERRDRGDQPPRGALGRGSSGLSRGRGPGRLGRARYQPEGSDAGHLLPDSSLGQRRCRPIALATHTP
jgi:S1-C subfamily serine protease